MATAFRHSHSDARAPERRLAEFFQREIAPRIGSFEAERVEARARFITTAIAFAAAIPILLYVLWPLDAGWAVLATAVPLAIGVTVLSSQQRKFRHRVRDLVMPAICAAIGDLQHGAGDESAIPFEDLESLGLLPNHNRRSIDDVFEGCHRGTGFIMAEARLRRRSGGRRRSTRTVFRGLILAIEVPREVRPRILIAREAGAVGNRLKGWIKGFSGLARVSLPHPAFEARFEVYSDNPAAAREVVGPGFCDAMAALADAHRERPIQAPFEAAGFISPCPSAATASAWARSSVRSTAWQPKRSRCCRRSGSCTG